MLHPTIEAASVPLPRWIPAANDGALRLVRLLVVWPSLPLRNLPFLTVTEDASLHEASGAAPSPATNQAQHSSSPESTAAENTRFTIEKCLQVGVAAARFGILLSSTRLTLAFCFVGIHQSSRCDRRPPLRLQQVWDAAASSSPATSSPRTAR